MASFSNIFVLFLPVILLSVSCCNVLYVSILLSRLLVRSKSVQKCSTAQSFTFPKFTSFKLGTLVNPLLNKSKRVFSSGGARTPTTREMEKSSLMLYQLSYQGLMLGGAILLVYILIPIFLTIFHHYLIFLETRPSWKSQ